MAIFQRRLKNDGYYQSETQVFHPDKNKYGRERAYGEGRELRTDRGKLRSLSYAP